MAQRILRATLRDGTFVERNGLCPQLPGAIAPGQPAQAGKPIFIDCMVVDMFLHPATKAEPARREVLTDEHGVVKRDSAGNPLEADVEAVAAEPAKLEVIGIPHVFVPVVAPNGQTQVMLPPWKSVKRDAAGNNVRSAEGGLVFDGGVGIYEQNKVGARILFFLDPEFGLSRLDCIEKIEALQEYCEAMNEDDDEDEDETPDGAQAPAAANGAPAMQVVPPTPVS